MKVELIRSSHSVGEANYHIQITPAYRAPVFEDHAVRTLTRDYILAAAGKHSITVAAIGFGDDHCHVFTAACKNQSAAQVARLLKGFSSRMMRKHHRDLLNQCSGATSSGQAGTSTGQLALSTRQQSKGMLSIPSASTGLLTAVSRSSYSSSRLIS
jgi:REP element-mobilizing transposase RayT